MDLTTATAILLLAALTLAALILFDRDLRFYAKVGLIAAALLTSAYYVVEAAKVIIAHIAG